MIKSDNLSDLAAALAKSQNEFPVIPKNKKAKIQTKSGRDYEYKYADLADVLNVCLPVLSKNGLSVTQLLGDKMVTILMHSSGQYIGEEYKLNEFEKIQEEGSEITYKRRYAVCALLGVHGEEDEDGTIANDSGKKKASKPLPVSGPNEREFFIKTLNETSKKRGWINSQVSSYIAETFNKTPAELSVQDLKDLIEEVIKYSYAEAIEKFREANKVVDINEDVPF